MENQLTTTKELFGQRSIQERFEKLLGKKSQGFISSVLQIVNGNEMLRKADPNTVLNAAATAAALDLPVNQSLGFSWIVPYKGQAQFQIGWKGLVQLALRTGQYKAINVTEVYENQYKSFNRLTEDLVADFNIDGEGEVVGYAAYISLKSGFEKTCYWTKEAVIKHAKKYSQAYNSKFSPWNDRDQFDAMAKKTVLKNTISKWGIMSIEMQTAQLADQSVQPEEGKYNYIDNTIDVEGQSHNEEHARIVEHIKGITDKADLIAIKGTLEPEQLELFKEEIEAKEKELK